MGGSEGTPAPIIIVAGVTDEGPSGFVRSNIYMSLTHSWGWP